MKQVTLKDLAKQLLLSTSTVSRALANDKNVRRETREHVQQVAQQLGYKPNPLARNLKSGKSQTIGVIVPEMVTPFAATVLEGIQEVMTNQGYRIIVAQSSEDPEVERKNLLMMRQSLVDGIIMSVCHKTYNLELCREFQQQGIPLVMFDRMAPALEAPKVTVNDYAKSMLMMEHLIRSGRQRIVHLKAPDYIHNAVERARAYRDSLSKFGIPYESNLLLETGLTFNDGRQAVERLLDTGQHFDAIFAFTDTIAIGAMNQLRERQYDVPKDVAVASFSGTELSTIVYPQLTTVVSPLHAMGTQAAELLLHLIKGHAPNPSHIVLDAALQYRGSTMDLSGIPAG